MSHSFEEKQNLSIERAGLNSISYTQDAKNENLLSSVTSSLLLDMVRFVRFEDHRGARKAMEELDGEEIEHRRIKLRKAH